MLRIFVRIAAVDEDGFVGRDHHPNTSMVGRLVRVTNMDTVPCTDSDETKDDGPFQVFHGMLVDALGQDERPVELVDHELESKDGYPVFYMPN